MENGKIIREEKSVTTIDLSAGILTQKTDYYYKGDIQSTKTINTSISADEAIIAYQRHITKSEKEFHGFIIKTTDAFENTIKTSEIVGTYTESTTQGTSITHFTEKNSYYNGSSVITDTIQKSFEYSSSVSDVKVTTVDSNLNKKELVLTRTEFNKAYTTSEINYGYYSSSNEPLRINNVSSVKYDFEGYAREISNLAVTSYDPKLHTLILTESKGTSWNNMNTGEKVTCAFNKSEVVVLSSSQDENGAKTYSSITKYTLKEFIKTYPLAYNIYNYFKNHNITAF
ncbi:MAG: hypothetical protein ACD_79C00156G0001 [uncultured bacterium]|nr:MAG: hypothetical protein ACD_79C00156G0001 [uncultured bacterium]